MTEAGAVLCWGTNIHGQLGNGTTTERHTPVPVSGLSRGVVAIAAGYYHTCALTDPGAVRCWGLNTRGQLGDGTTTSRNAPVGVGTFGAGTALLPAGARFSKSGMNAGEHAISARYEGDAFNEPSPSAMLAHVVTKGPTDTAIKVKPKSGKSARIKVVIDLLP